MLHFENTRPVPSGKIILDYKETELRTPDGKEVLVKNFMIGIMKVQDIQLMMERKT